MSNPFLAEIRVLPFAFAPKGWAMAQGQLLPISQNTALFSLLGTFYGGDGKSNFALPNTQGNCSFNQGQGPGLSLYDLGEQGGVGNVTLLTTEFPSHNHVVNCDGGQATGSTPAGGALAQPKAAGINMYSSTSSKGGATTLNPMVITSAGGSQPHNNMMPFIGLNWCIALQGVFPARS